MDGDNIAVLDPEVMTDDTVQASAAIVKVIVGQNNKNGILPLLATDQDGIAAEELEGVHGVGGQDNGRVVIIYGIGNPRVG